jgi:hypothetical protein
VIKFTWKGHSNPIDILIDRVNKKLDFPEGVAESMLIGRWENKLLINHRKIIMRRAHEWYRDKSGTVGYYE